MGPCYPLASESRFTITGLLTRKDILDITVQRRGLGFAPAYPNATYHLRLDDRGPGLCLGLRAECPGLGRKAPFPDDGLPANGVAILVFRGLIVATLEPSKIYFHPR